MEREQQLKASDVVRMIKQLSPSELYKLADFMDFGDEGMHSQDIHEAIECADYGYSLDGEDYVCELSLGLFLGVIKVKISYKNIAAEGEDPDYGEYEYEIIEQNRIEELEMKLRHAHDDLKFLEQHCREQQREIDDLKRNTVQLKLAQRPKKTQIIEESK